MRLTKFEKAWYTLLLIGMVAGFFLARSTNPNIEAQAILEARKIPCDIGQIPLDCIGNPKKKGRSKKSKKC